MPKEVSTILHIKEPSFLIKVWVWILSWVDKEKAIQVLSENVLIRMGNETNWRKLF